MQGDARQLVREGRVTATFPERHTVRVEFEDKDNMTSAEMPVLTLCAAENKFYSLPDVGTSVVCLFASNADQTGTGWIIGSRFNDKSKPNANSQDVTRLDFKDGTFIEYNRDSHKMHVSCKGEIFAEAEKNVTVKTKAKVFVEADSDVDVKTKGKVTANADGDITLKSGGDIVFDAGGEIVFSGAKSYALKATGSISLIANEQVLVNGGQILIGE